MQHAMVLSMLLTCLSLTHRVSVFSQQQAMMGQKLAEMSQEERAGYMQQQMEKLEHAMQAAAVGVPDAADTAMSQSEQASFLSGGGKGGKDS